MLKKLFIAAIVLFAGSSTYAQDQTNLESGSSTYTQQTSSGSSTNAQDSGSSSNAQQTNLDLGFQVSPTFGKFKSDGSKSQTRTDVSYGLMADILFRPRYALNTGFYISGIGGRVINGDNMNGSDLTYKLKYIEIPTAIKLRTNTMGKTILYGEMGLMTGINIAAKKDGTSTSNGVTTTYDNTKIKSDVNLFRMGYIVGGGMEYILFNDTRAILGITYNQGLTDVMDNSGRATNSYVAINVGMFF